MQSRISITVICSIIVLLASHTARAGFLIEPYVGQIAVGDSTQTGTVADSTGNFDVEFEHSGAVYGARFGYLFDMGAFFALDYSKTRIDLERLRTENPVVLSADINEFHSHHIGLVLGYETESYIHFWAGYFLGAKWVDRDGADKYDYFEGGGFVVGLGINFYKDFYLNVEFRAQSLDEFFDASSGQPTILGNSEINRNEFIVGVSLPIDLDIALPM